MRVVRIGARARARLGLGLRSGLALGFVAGVKVRGAHQLLRRGEVAEEQHLVGVRL